MQEKYLNLIIQMYIKKKSIYSLLVILPIDKTIKKYIGSIIKMVMPSEETVMSQEFILKNTLIET